MKKGITICLLVATIGIVKAQQLRGTQEFNTFGGSRYTIVNWSVNYQIILKGDAFYISLSNPKVSAAPSSLYGNANGGGKLYSKTELGLSIWPDSDPTPYNMEITLNLQYPDGTNKKQSATIREDSYIVSITQFNNLKNASPSSFKVTSVESMQYNGGGDGIVDKLIAAKNNGNTNSSTNSKTNSLQDNATPNNTSTKPLDNYDPNTGLYSNPMTNSTNATSYNKDLQRTELVIDVANGILDLFATSPEEKARKEREAAEKKDKQQRSANLRREAAVRDAAEKEIAKVERIKTIGIENYEKEELKVRSFMDSLCQVYKFKLGLTESEFINYNPPASKIIKPSKSYRSNGGHKVMYSHSDTQKLGINIIDFTDGIVSRYQETLVDEKGNEKCQSLFTNLLNDVKKNIPSSYFEYYIGQRNDYQSISIYDEKLKFEIEIWFIYPIYAKVSNSTVSITFNYNKLKT